MAVVILSRDDLRRMLRERRRRGADHLDEVWNGVYVMSPEADTAHQFLAKRLVRTLDDALADRPGILVYPTINISDRKGGWRKNYRVPDASVFLPGNPAEDCGPYYFGGPDFAVEIRSPGDRSRKKLAFYAKVGVRELLLVERKPWCLELYRCLGGTWELVGRSDLTAPTPLASDVLSLSFRLVPGPERPQIEVTRPADGQTWLA